ncbi:MAG: hypothetical protein JZU65_20530 [Chlorobium sp.]|nr:hypothetical protein [Chlorobium sp.]
MSSERPLKPDYLSSRFLANRNNGEARTLYTQASYCRESILYGGKAMDSDALLSAIAEEIGIRVKITQQEMFFIGELLSHAKALMKSTTGDFKGWVEKNCGFGYHTALNFINVYIACMGKLEFVRYVKPSILYQISAPQFPEQLRDLLMFSEMLEGMKNSDVKDILLEYQEKGHDEVKKKLENKSRISLSLEHSRRHIDGLQKAIYELQKIDSSFGKIERNIGHELGKGITPEGDSINSIITKALRRSISDLKNVENVISDKIQKASEKFNNRSKVKEEPQVVSQSNDLTCDTIQENDGTFSAILPPKDNTVEPTDDNNLQTP